MATLYRGDDTAAFNNSGFITINLDTAFDVTISKAIFQCGSVKKTFIDPTFPLIINLTASETKQLQAANMCHLAIWDENNYKRTCDGSLQFGTQSGVVG